MQKVRFAYNPKAGETVITDWLDNIIDIYQRGGYSIMPYRLAFTETERPTCWTTSTAATTISSSPAGTARSTTWSTCSNGGTSICP